MLGYPGGMRSASFRARSDPHRADRILSKPPAPGFGPRGGDVDADGVYWVSLASGHLGSFDRRKCKVAQRADRHRQALPGRLDAASAAGPAIPHGERSRQRRGQLLRLGRLVRHVRARTQRSLSPWAISTTRSSPWWTASSSTCAFPTPWACSPRTSTGGSMIRMPAGRARALWTTTGTRTFFHNEGGKRLAAEGDQDPDSPRPAGELSGRIWREMG